MAQTIMYTPKLLPVETDQYSYRTEPEVVSNETDEEIIERLRTRFTILEDMTRAVKRGDVRAMIVSGPPGVGKSYGVDRVLSRNDILAAIANDPSLKQYDIIKGMMSGLMLYRKLYDFRDAKSVLVLDDVDSIFGDEVSLNILKTALDSGARRMISWNTDSRYLKDEGIPNTFEYHGGCILITNLKFANVKSKKLRDHLEALESRCHYLDLLIDTNREKMLRIRQIVKDGMLDKFELEESEIDEIVEYICDNKARVRELSLRTVIKAAELKKGMPNSWKSIADMTLMMR